MWKRKWVIILNNVNGASFLLETYLSIPMRDNQTSEEGNGNPRHMFHICHIVYVTQYLQLHKVVTQGSSLITGVKSSWCDQP
jgi:hypothetical protein